MRSINYTLTDAKLKALKPQGKPYKVADGGGLFVRISPAGTKAWAFAYTYGKKEAPKESKKAKDAVKKGRKAYIGITREIGFGSYPEVSIKAARDLHFAARQALAEEPPRDPAATKRERKARSTDGDGTFRAVSEKWLADCRRERKWAPGTDARIKEILTRDIWPTLGPIPLTSVKPADVLAIIKPKATKHPTTAAKIRSIVADIYDTAISHLLAETNPATPLRKAVSVPTPTNHPHLEADELGAWWNAMEALEARAQPSTINAIRFLALTLCRKTEVTDATWDEIEGLKDEGDGPVMWTIPLSRMKMRAGGGRGDHKVPLSKQAVAILREQKKRPGSGDGKWIFTPLGLNKPLDRTTLNAAFTRIQGGVISPHGLRSTGATIIMERKYASSDVVEKLLAHQARGIIAVYQRQEMLEERRAALQAYADAIDELAAVARGENVVPIGRAAAVAA